MRRAGGLGVGDLAGRARDLELAAEGGPGPVRCGVRGELDKLGGHDLQSEAPGARVAEAVFDGAPCLVAPGRQDGCGRYLARRGHLQPRATGRLAVSNRTMGTGDLELTREGFAGCRRRLVQAGLCQLARHDREGEAPAAGIAEGVFRAARRPVAPRHKGVPGRYLARGRDLSGRSRRSTVRR